MEATTEVQGAVSQQVSGVRTSPRLYTQVWSVPYLLPGDGLGRENPGSKEIKLVRYVRRDKGDS